MADAAVKRGGLVGALASTKSFLDGARGEIKKVTWPTRDELIKATRMIVILSLVLGVVIGLLDLLLQQIFVRGVALLVQ